MIVDYDKFAEQDKIDQLIDLDRLLYRLSDTVDTAIHYGDNIEDVSRVLKNEKYEGLVKELKKAIDILSYAPTALKTMEQRQKQDTLDNTLSTIGGK